jgi:hypothetical protein
MAPPALRATLCWDGALAQLGERRLCKPEVTGSIPVRSTTESPGNGALLFPDRTTSVVSEGAKSNAVATSAAGLGVRGSAGGAEADRC